MEENDYDFPTSCIGILADLWAKDGINQKDLGASLIKNKSSINKMLVALENSDMIYKKEDTVDKRIKRIYLTEKGKAMQVKMEQKQADMEQHLISDISQEEIQTTKNVLAQMYQSLMALPLSQDK
jgi:DNA-binding MarR family transcriptional regulator